MKGLLRIVTAAALLFALPALAHGRDCDRVVWSDAHGHYHCADLRHDAYYAPYRARVPVVYIDLSPYPHRGYWRRHGGHWGWYAPPHFRPHFHGPYCGHRW